ncbi:MAG: phosphoribosylamine--glycine ligase, partial [Candidatus Saccharimonas sp.]|nr:phosphoribosylamine--glycine ligase [Planctomycetaceae bacterium]
MKILVVGNGGREHTLVWKLKQSPSVTQVFCAPGNAGTGLDGTNVDIKATDIPRLIKFATAEKIDLTVIGPEAPLVAGIVDEFQKAGLRVFGPSKKAAELEGSKKFAKELMKRAN